MGKRLFVLALSLWVVSVSRPVPEAAILQNAPPAAQHRAVVTQYCVTCHSDALKTGGLSLEKMDFTDLGPGAEI